MARKVLIVDDSLTVRQQVGACLRGAGFDVVEAVRVGITGPAEVSNAPALILLVVITAAFGVASALYQRTHTGKGQLVDVSLLRTGLYTLHTDLAIQLFFGRIASTRPRAAGNTESRPS